MVVLTHEVISLCVNIVLCGGRITHAVSCFLTRERFASIFASAILIQLDAEHEI